MEYIPLDSYVKKKTRAILFLLIACIALSLKGGVHPGLVTIVAIIGSVIYSYMKKTYYPKVWSKTVGKLAYSARELDEDNFKKEIIRHLPVLARKRNMLITSDDYGNIIVDPWVKEKKYYISKLNYFPHVTPYYSGMDDFDQFLILDEMIDDYLQFNDVESINIIDMTPTEYEHYCADVLRDQGWEARVTKGSGDQGVDVLAEKNGVTIAVQCKKYSSPVGNKAVQEVAAGKGFYGADYGMVVTNNTYTASAKQLANSQLVFLLHHDDLYSIDELIDVGVNVA
ncbi:hypothetical protein BS639_17225 [Rouxiella silvae]|uniref:Restriction endonuclease type IV Mrr domain-containing protein n=1 Tax=Rouxiella silvae TaxID=1646373 RepID=A0ABX3TXY5_9GAMM|nr:restriction endonuclease [Rouxiella silvae]ORJ20035.1 hypothetical protein BS639_17225 [Rouxiella silvae]